MENKLLSNDFNMNVYKVKTILEALDSGWIIKKNKNDEYKFIKNKKKLTNTDEEIIKNILNIK